VDWEIAISCFVHVVAAAAAAALSRPALTFRTQQLLWKGVHESHHSKYSPIFVACFCHLLIENSHVYAQTQISQVVTALHHRHHPRYL